MFRTLQHLITGTGGGVGGGAPKGSSRMPIVNEEQSSSMNFQSQTFSSREEQPQVDEQQEQNDRKDKLKDYQAKRTQKRLQTMKTMKTLKKEAAKKQVEIAKQPSEISQSYTFSSNNNTSGKESIEDKKNNHNRHYTNMKTLVDDYADELINPAKSLQQSQETYQGEEYTVDENNKTKRKKKKRKGGRQQNLSKSRYTEQEGREDEDDYYGEQDRTETLYTNNDNKSRNMNQNYTTALDKQSTLDSNQKLRKKILKKMGVFRRLNIDPKELLNYEPKMQELIIKKYVSSDIKPSEALHFIEQLNKVSSQIINTENEMDVVYYHHEDGNESQMSNDQYHSTAHQKAWRNGRWDYGMGYYAMQADVPKGLEYAAKAKLNHMKIELEMFERNRELMEFKAIEAERLKKEAEIDPEEAKIHAEFLQLFLDGLHNTIDKPIQLYDKEMADIYTEDNKPNVLIQLMAKGMAKLTLKVANQHKRGKILNAIDYRNHKASKVAAKNEEQMREAEFKKIQEVKRGVAMLKQMRDRQEEIRIAEQFALNQRLEADVVNPTKKSRNNNQVNSRTVVDVKANQKLEQKKSKAREYASISENSDEDRESFPLDDKSKKQIQFKSIADDQFKDHFNQAYSISAIKSGIKTNLSKINLKVEELSRTEKAKLLQDKLQQQALLAENALNSIPLLEQVPAVSFKHDINKWTRVKVHNNNIIMIKPDFDASDKQIFARNNYKTNAENLDMFLEKRNEDKAGSQIFKPQMLGDLSHKQDGVMALRSENPASVNIDFQLSYLLDGNAREKLDKQKRLEMAELNKKLKAMEVQQKKINQKIINGEDLNAEEQQFLLETQGASKVQQVMQGYKDHMKNINAEETQKLNAKKSGTQSFNKHNSKIMLSRTNTVKNSNMSGIYNTTQSETNFTSHNVTNTKTQTVKDEPAIDQINDTMLLLGNNDQLKRGGITSAQKEHLEMLYKNKNLVKNMFSIQISEHERRVMEHAKVSHNKIQQAQSQTQSTSDLRGQLAKSTLMTSNQSQHLLRETAVDIIRKGQEEHEELMMAINRKKEILSGINHPHHNHHHDNPHANGGKHGDGDVLIGGVVVAKNYKNNKTRNLL